jgi:hypothetical protein
VTCERLVRDFVPTKDKQWYNHIYKYLNKYYNIFISFIKEYLLLHGLTLLRLQRYFTWILKCFVFQKRLSESQTYQMCLLQLISLKMEAVLKWYREVAKR